MKKILLICSLIVTLFSCSTSGYEDISLSDVRVDNFSFQSSSQIQLILGMKVDNPTNKTISITDANLNVYQGESNIAVMQLDAPTVIAPKTNDYNTAVMQIQVKNILALIGLNPEDSSLLDKFEVEGFVKVKSGIAVKKIKIDRMSARNLLQSLK